MRITKPLTDADCRNLKPDPDGKSPKRVYDGGGLYLEALPGGRKVWRLKYKAAGRETRATFGDYPAVTLAAARRKRDEARGMLAHGLDVNAEVDRQRQATVDKTEGTFAAVVVRWKADEHRANSDEYQRNVSRMLERDVLPFIGERPITDIKPRELIAVFDRIRERGVEETARRARTIVGQVFRYAIRRGICEVDPTQPLRGERRIKPVKHFAALTDPADVSRLMTAIHGYRGTPEVRAALKLSALLFQRPGEIRAMTWDQIDFDAAQWRYVVSKTKRHTAQTHIVPLPVQALTVLRELQPLTDHGLSLRPGSDRYVFPTPKTRLRPMSENAVRQALRNMGFTNDEMTAHGFRAMARSLLAELGWKTDAIERQLSHKAAGPLGAAYDRAAYLDERKAMMQAWADYLDRLRNKSNVVAIRSGTV